MSNYLKFFKAEFEKYARPAPVRKSRQTASPTAVTSPAPGATRHAPQKGQARPTADVGVSGSAVKNMQLSIQSLAKLISSTIDYNTLVKSMSQPETADKKQFEKSYGRDAFSNFMVNRYLRNSDMKGVEYDPMKSKITEKNPTELKSMYNLLKSLQDIGNQTSESFADGNWGQRTNNALLNVVAIADSVMKLGKDLGMESKAFDVNKLSAFKPLVPEKDTDISVQEKIKRSPSLTELLNGVRALFIDFKSQVLQNPYYSAFIDEKEPLFKVGPAKKKEGPELEGGEKSIYEDLKSNPTRSRFVYDNTGTRLPSAAFNINIPTENLPVQYKQVKVPPFQITGADLISKQSFDNLINSNSVLMNMKQGNPESWNNVIQIILQQVKEQIKQKMGQAPQAVPQGK